MPMLRLKLLSVVLITLLLTACGGNAPAASGDEPTPPPAAPQQSPTEVVSAFLDAWNEEDYATMHTYLHPISQEQYPYEVFERRFTVVDGDIDIDGINYEIHTVDLQGESAAVHYDLTFVSSTYSNIPDPDRTMRLMRTPDGWRIAWSSMDILEGLAGGGYTRVDSRASVRGHIYDRNGEYLVEEGGAVVILRAQQSRMNNVDNCIDYLTDLLRERRANLVRLFASYLDETIFYVGEIDREIYLNAQNDLSNICGIFQDDTATIPLVTEYTTRRYYGNGAAAHVTGYVSPVTAEQLQTLSAQGYRSGDIIGQTGIEQRYDQQLAGRPERYLVVSEPGGAVVDELGGTTGAPSVDVRLTIDRDLQVIVAQALSDAYNYAEPNWGGVSTGGAAVVIDVNTGEILAMASYPSYNPSIFSPDTPNPDVIDVRAGLANDVSRRPLVNKATNDRYSPGSVFKIITVAAILNEGLIAPDEEYDCQLEWNGARYGDTAGIRLDWRATDGFDAAGPITPWLALTSSCDPFFWEYSAQLYQRGSNLLIEYAQRMGMTGLTGIEIPEVRSELAPPRSVDEALNNAIGQGSVEVTPLAMVQVTAAIANGGTIYQPYIVQQVGDGPVSEPRVIGQFDLNPGVLEAVQRGMCEVPFNEDFGTAILVFGDGVPYTLCGKTGSAQTALYPNAWFVAYAPADNPQIAVVVMVANSLEGSQVAAPIVRRILDDYFNVAREPWPEWWRDPYEPLNVPGGGVPGG